MDQTPHQGDALVIGAGIAGLLAAHVLSRSFATVTVLERDHLPETPRPRRGVPQGRHAHALQAGGLLALEQLLPGISDDLRAAGAPRIDFCVQARLHLPYGTPPPRDSGIIIQPASRPLLESVLRERVMRTDNIRIDQGCTVTGLLSERHRHRLRVTGVRLVRRNTRAPADERSVPGNLVVDASGRASHLPDWLAALGLPRPAETVIDARVGYATRAYHLPPGRALEWSAVFQPPHAPHSPRGCFVLRVENDQLLVTLQGAGGDHPPTDPAGFDAFTASLHGDVREVLQDLVPISSAVRYARTANRRLHYDRLRPWPGGLIALGDAVCAFNPVYAQGMTVAALEALTLAALLADRTQASALPLEDLTQAFQRRVARVTAWPWQLATLPDRGWRLEPPRSLPHRGARWYLDQWQRLVPQDPRMFHDIARVTNMLASPLLLARPRHLIRVGKAAVRRNPRPARPRTPPPTPASIP
ncbi:NAD(P)-binding protein [Streptomyces spectabilis]|uniref:FAD-dependent oxidoreductase n=1 Tax=Streptomyces spectabilis TaxID=68270 RepID=UPI003409E1AC